MLKVVMKMRHVTALLLKFLMVTVVLEIALYLLTDLSFAQIMYISLAVTLVAYVLSDIIILPLSNNTAATISDIALTAFTIYMFNYIQGFAMISIWDSLIASAVIGVGEWFFHKFLIDKILPERKRETI